MADNVVIAKHTNTIITSWSVSVCERGVGDKAPPGEGHSQSAILIQQGQTSCVGGCNTMSY